MDTHGLERMRTGIAGKGPRNADNRASTSIMLLYLAAGMLILTRGPGLVQAWAGSLSSTITIRAQVLPFVKVTSLMQREHLIVSESDARRGLVEISSGSLIEVKSNIPNGCSLAIEVNGFPFERASANIQGRKVTLSENGGFIHWPLQGSIIVPIDYVITLKPGTKPGVYPWPFRLTVSL